MNQSLPLVEQLRNLEHLQELDLRMDAIRRNQGNLPSALKTIDDDLNKLKTSLAAKDQSLTEAEKVHRQTLAAIELNQDRLTRANSKLESVHNSQEFQAATKEIDQLKKLEVSLAEQTKKSVADLDVLRSELQSLKEQVAGREQERGSQASVVSGQESQLQSDLATLATQRLEYSSKVERRILSQYDRVRAARGGLGIVPAVGGRRKGCNMMVPPQLYNEVQKGTTLHSCPSCHRLLFVPFSSQKVDGPQGE